MSSIVLNSDLPVDLLTTNRAPSDNELTIARTLIRDIENQLRGSATGTVNAHAESGHTETAMLESLAALKSVVAPIRRVPTDVIREIFLACFDPEYSFSDISSSRIPGSLAHICSGLRKVALSTPALWVSLCVIITMNASESRLRRQKYWLEELIYHRSGNAPLHVRLFNNWVTKLHQEQSINADYNNLLGLLFSCHSRWREATLSSTDFKTYEHIFSCLSSLTPNDFPLLRKIDLCTVDVTVANTPSYTPLLACPALKKVSNVTFDNIIDHQFYLPLSNITDLQCTCGKWRPSLFIDFANILRRCISLVSLTFTAGGRREWVKAEIHLPLLESLSITEDFTTLCIFSAIKAPRLQSLNLDLRGLQYFAGRFHNPSGYSGEIADFIRRSPNLQTLQLFCQAEMNADLLLMILQSCPQLVTFVCFYTSCCYSGWDTVLGAFVGVHHSRIMCPNLQNLDVAISIVKDFDTLNKLFMRKLEPSPLLAPWKRLKIRFIHLGQVLLFDDHPPRITIEPILVPDITDDTFFA